MDKSEKEKVLDAILAHKKANAGKNIPHSVFRKTLNDIIDSYERNLSVEDKKWVLKELIKIIGKE